MLTSFFKTICKNCHFIFLLGMIVTGQSFHMVKAEEEIPSQESSNESFNQKNKKQPADPFKTLSSSNHKD